MKVSSTAAPRLGPALLAVLALLWAGAAGHAPAAAPGGAGQDEFPVAEPDPGQARPGDTPFDRQGMWVWYVERTEGGDPARIAARAKRAGIGTLYIKSGDGGDYWSQFSSSLVERLQRAGLDVCAWQFVYGDSPLAEARVAAAAVRRGADCFVIDAEGQYEGKYAAADRYIRALRARIGDDYPLSLAAFPYVDYHPAFPYSVFLGPGGATYNQPQMYWKAIGTSVREVYEHTYLFNRLWKAPLYPLGQTYQQPRRRELTSFRRFAENYAGQAVSWWAWHETNRSGWGALAADLAGPVFGYRPTVSHPVLRRGSRGDIVVWAQMHLRAAIRTGLLITGMFGPMTRSAVREFQSERGIRADGVIGQSTWRALLKFEPVRPGWGGRKGRRAGAGASSAARPSRPLSASLPATAYEVDPGPSP